MRTGCALPKISCLLEDPQWFLALRRGSSRRSSRWSRPETSSNLSDPSHSGSECQRWSLHQTFARGSARAFWWPWGRRLIGSCWLRSSTRRRARSFLTGSATHSSTYNAKVTTLTRTGRLATRTTSRSTLPNHLSCQTDLWCRARSHSPPSSRARSRRVIRPSTSSEWMHSWLNKFSSRA